jgi:hydrogenase maturation protein HypF
LNDAQRWHIGGGVQGVGYRPYVYRLARSLRLTGWVRNNAGAVEIHAEGAAESLEAFAQALFSGPPPTARARLLARRPVPRECRPAFTILTSAADGERHARLPLDLASCRECIAELNDPRARRHRYPFINCTQCGPRYTIIRDLPYDRGNTTLSEFDLCTACADEYANPDDRRFHAQALACAECGPTVYWVAAGQERVRESRALAAAVEALRAGKIIAVRGVGGYHLLCDASSDAAVLRLRQRKGRRAKPLAVMIPCAGEDGLAQVRLVANIAHEESAALSDASRPIVVLRRISHATICASVSPNLADIGVMLPYSPLHCLLLDDFGAPLVATSGNVRGEPVLTDPDEAQERLAPIADGFLHHNRPIARPAEDPVVRFMAGAVRPLRMGRGTAPIELELSTPVSVPTLAVGAYQKSTVALAYGYRAIVSPHLGDQSTPRGRAIFAQTILDMQRLYGIRAERVLHDAHPQFPSTRWALDGAVPATAIWHHHAHASAVAGEYRREAPMLCFTWDGVGLGSDRTLWGGEALLGNPGSWRRVASFRPFKLPGGERAAHEPWRTALSLCWQTGVTWARGASRGESWRGGASLRQAFDRDLNSPITTSVGRLFEAASALCDVCMESSFEAEPALRLEALCESREQPVALPLERDAAGLWRTDWMPLLALLLDQRRTQSFRAARFHSSMAHALLAQAIAVRDEARVTCVGLAGGVFQNRVLTEHASSLLEQAGFEVLIPKLLPLNDAATSFGQLLEGNTRHAPAG